MKQEYRDKLAKEWVKAIIHIDTIKRLEKIIERPIPRGYNKAINDALDRLERDY